MATATVQPGARELLQHLEHTSSFDLAEAREGSTDTGLPEDELLSDGIDGVAPDLVSGWYERLEAAQQAWYDHCDHELMVILGDELRSMLEVRARGALRAGVSPWKRAPRDRNADILKSRRERPWEWRPLGLAAPVVIAPRTSARTRGAGRPRAVARASSRGGDSGDDGSGSTEGGGDEPPPPAPPLAHTSTLRKLAGRLARLFGRGS